LRNSYLTLLKSSVEYEWIKQLNEQKQKPHTELYKKFTDKAKDRYQQLIALVSKQQKELEKTKMLRNSYSEEKLITRNDKEYIEANISGLVAQKVENEKLERELIVNSTPTEQHYPSQRLFHEMPNTNIENNDRENMLSSLSNGEQIKSAKYNTLRSTIPNKNISKAINDKISNKSTQRKSRLCEYIAPVRFKNFEKINRRQKDLESKTHRKGNSKENEWNRAIRKSVSIAVHENIQQPVTAITPTFHN